MYPIIQNTEGGEDRTNNKKHSCLFSLITVLLLLTAFLTGDLAKSSDRCQYSELSGSSRISASIADRLHVVTYNEKESTAETQYISSLQRHSTHPQYEMPLLTYCGISFSVSVLLLFILIRIIECRIVRSSRFIIKFIHDKDGYKGTSLFY